MKRSALLFTIFFACAAASPPAAPSPSEALTSIGATMDVPPGFTVSDVGPLGKVPHAAIAQFMRSSPVRVVSVWTEDLGGRTVRQVAEELGMAGVNGTPSFSGAIKACGGSQDGWTIEGTGAYGVMHLVSAVLGNRVATAQYTADRQTPGDVEVFAALESLCAGTAPAVPPVQYVAPAAASSAPAPSMHQLLGSIGVDANIPDGWTLVDGAAPNGVSGGAVVFMSGQPSRTGAFDLISISTDDLKKQSLQAYVANQAPQHPKVSHAKRMCGGTQNGWLFEAIVQGNAMQATFAVNGSRVAVMEYMHKPGTAANAQAVKSLDTLCAK